MPPPLTPLLALAALFCLSPRAARAACTREETALTSECGGQCYDGRPCVAFADADAALCETGAATFGTCATDAGSGCVFECFTNGPDDFVANGIVDFSDYVFFLTLDASSSSSSSADNDTDEHPSIAASTVSVIEPLGLRNTTTQVVIAGGESVDGARDRVANVTLSAKLLAADAGLDSVTLANLALGASPIAEGTFPPQLTALALPNCQLADYPLDLPLLVQLEELDLSRNELATVPSAFASPTLRTLNLSSNAIADLEVDAGDLGNLTTLDLAGNALTSIPTQIFSLSGLQTLNLSGNPFTDVALTQAQVAFLDKLGALSVDSFGGVDNCAASYRTNVSGVAVCLTAIEGDSSGDEGTVGSSSSSSSGGSGTGAIVGGVVGGLAAIAIVGGVFLLRRKRKEKDEVHGHPDDHLAPLEGKPAEGTTAGTTGDSTHPPVLSNSYPHPSSASMSSSQPRDTGTSGSLWTDQELLSLQVNLDDVQDVRKIGSGAFCVVYLATFRKSRYVASKRLKRDEVSWSSTQRFIDEIKLVAKLDHPHVVKLVGVAWSIEADLQALFEFMERGDLRSHLERTALGDRSWWPTHEEDAGAPRREADKLQMAIDVVEALVYVHSFTPPLVHRDLKSRNVLLDGGMRAHVSDFGVARYKSMDATMTTGVGTGRWLAPEVISGASDYDQSCDIFSFGVVLSEMDTHALPYADARGPGGHKIADVAVLQLVAAGRLLPSFSRECPSRIRELALRCMAFDRRERPSAVEVAYALRSLQKSVALSSGGFVV